MPRRGKEISYAAMEANSDLEFAAIEDMHEEDVAELMKSSAYFLATSEGEWFGLPALEAMAAGCLVLSVPVLGGMEYLHHGANSFVVEREEIPLKLKELHMMKNSEFLSRVRHLAISTAMSYSRAQQLKVLSQLVDGNEGLFNASFA
jgi:glycosyltransferase involved in cell wall biosynthesis